MLVDFTVENYRSIKSSVILSAVAQKGRIPERNKTNASHSYIRADSDIAPTSIVTGRGFGLLPVLGIFGANASGKTNILLALDKLLNLMANGNSDFHAPFPPTIEGITPFRLSKVTSASPTRFNLRVALGGIIYTYALTLSQERIVEERLDHIRPTAKRNSLLFQRLWSDHAGQYIWKNGSELGTYRRLQDTVREREIFLSLLTTRFNVDILQAFSDWTQLRWQGLGHEEFNHVVSMHQLTRMGQSWRNQVVQILRRFDTGLLDVEVQTGQIGSPEPRLVAVHNNGEALIRWPFEEESTGTQRLFDLANKVLSSLDTGRMMLEDELGSNIHPNITREIVRLFQSPVTNPKRAQLIFTSHDNALQQRNLLRRDQIWFTEKQTDGSTELYPLTDFKPRNDLAVDKAYLDGRFGAVPLLPDTEDIVPDIGVSRRAEESIEEMVD